MKSLTLTLLLLLPLLTRAQPKKTIDGVWGIPFGTTAQIARQIAVSKGAEYDTAHAKANVQIYTNVKFAHRQIDTLRLYFIKNALWHATISYPKYDNIKLFSEYDTMVKELTTIYGIAKLYANFNSGYSKGDGHEIYAISAGYADYGAIWTVSKQGSPANTVELNIRKDLHFVLTYTDGTRKKAVDKKNAAIKFQDY